MDVVELREPDAARRFVLQGLWLTRATRPAAPLVRQTLEWAFEIAASGSPLPPVGFVGDLGVVALGHDRGRTPTADAIEIPGWPATLARSYEDHVLGKLYSDWTFERASDALRRYVGRDQAKGLDYVVRQIRERAGLGGVLLSPAVLRGMMNQSGDELLAQGFESLTQSGPLPELVRQYERLVSAARRTPEVLGPEDLIALEQKTAIADMGQYVAHRQILQACARIESRLPARPSKPAVGRKEVPTRVLDEDRYPVGGYTSIATNGSIESLLHSQLAYMEEEQPDLFDMKFVRDELFYYSRDENQFLRRRRTFTFAFAADSVSARYKDAALPAQRIVYALAATLALVRRLTDWLSVDALKFELVFLAGPTRETPLTHERELLQLLMREAFDRGAAVALTLPDAAALGKHLDAESRTSQVHALLIAQTPPAVPGEHAVVTALTVAAATPGLTDGRGDAVELEGDDAAEAWADAVARTLALWV